MKRDLIRLVAGMLAICGLFSSCATQNGSPIATSGGLRSGDTAINRNSIDAILNNPKPERPGLATGWGQEKYSPTYTRDFVRSSSQPAGTDVIYYNNLDGINAMTTDASRVEALQPAAGGLVQWGIRGGIGYLTAYKENGFGRRLVAGEKGGHYALYVRNVSKSTLEIVASVDGLDVQDGKSASFSKRGYLVDAGGSILIDGFRTSHEAVAAFKFSGVNDSYANLRHGSTRNVGVIGIAVFTQKGVNPWTWMPEEVHTRDSARPFAKAP